MSTIISFENIIAWQKAQELAVRLYRQFASVKDYGFRDQLFRAVVSIGNNIAEGYERKGNNEFKYFLFIAKGSSAEVRSMLYLAQELGYGSSQVCVEGRALSTEISKLLSGLIKTL